MEKVATENEMALLEKPYVVLNEKRFYPERRKFKHIKKIGNLMINTVTTLAVAKELGEKELIALSTDIMNAPYSVLSELYPDVTEEDVDESCLDEIIGAFFASIKMQGLDLLKNSMAPLQQTMTLAKSKK